MAYEHARGETLWRLPELPTVAELDGYHVTDDPRPVEIALRAGIPLDRGMDASLTDDLKASGLYFSRHPQLWTSRAINKWRFVEQLAPEQRTAIAETMRQDSRFTREGYLTDGEKERGIRWLERFVENGHLMYLEFLAEQPYNFASWKPSFLTPLGIANNDTPHTMPVRVQGSFVDVSSTTISPDLMIALKLAGHDGAYVNGSMAFVSQAVVWNNSAIVQFGAYEHRPDQHTLC